MTALAADLRRAGIRTAVVSNKIESAVEALARRFFGDTLEAAVGDRPGRQRKPAPDGVLAALDALGMGKRDTAVYVGDSEVDLETARNAGVPCLAVCWGNRTEAQLRAAGAERIFADAAALREALL